MVKLKISDEFSSSSGTNDISTITEEEEYMAKCLMLLSHGVLSPPPPSEIKLHKCKTCFKAFSSFQALGGHRASHKRPKSIEEFDEEQEYEKPNTKIRIHECLICGSGFSSGQALSGHMRRHQQKKKQKILVELDLNFPSAAGEDRDTDGRWWLETGGFGLT